MPSARLNDRATFHVSGPDAEHFLQNLITTDLDQLPVGEARPGALLTPQGKILNDFLVSRMADSFRIDIAAEARDAFAKRLALYKLRAKVSIDPSDEAVGASYETTGDDGSGPIDRRFSAPVQRLYGDAAEVADDALAGDFAAMRIAAGVAECGADYPPSEYFPHDVLLDQNGGVSFRKGCFVGQEVVSRMQHRGTARRRIVILRGERHLTPGANVDADGRPIGTVLNAAETVAMAVVRIDKLADALRSDAIVSVDGVPVEPEIPSWAGYTLPDAIAEEEA